MKTGVDAGVQLRDRAVRMVREHANEHASEWATICSIAEKVGCNAETLRLRVRRAERDRGARSGLGTDERDCKIACNSDPLGGDFRVQY